jgi:hypothetical protein
MPGFGITPIYPTIPNDPPEFAEFIQFQSEDVDLSGPTVQIVNFLSPLKATRGVGENAHIITVSRTIPRNEVSLTGVQARCDVGSVGVILPIPILLLMHFDGNTFGWIDELGRTVTTHGAINPYVPTGGNPASKFGAAAGGFPGAGFSNYLTAPSTSLLNLGTDPWVVDFWVPVVPATAHPNYAFSMSKDGSSIYPLIGLHAESDAGPWGFTASFSSASQGNSFTAIITQSIPNPGSGPFVFVRFGRIDATTVGISVNGAAPTTATIPSSASFTPPGTSTVYVGWTVNGDTSDNTWAGAIDELCIRGEAMNSTSFTPPTAAWVYP